VAGVNRGELFETNAGWARFNVHSLRHSFVTRTSHAVPVRILFAHAPATNLQSCCDIGRQLEASQNFS